MQHQFGMKPCDQLMWDAESKLKPLPADKQHPWYEQAGGG